MLAERLADALPAATPMLHIDGGEAWQDAARDAAARVPPRQLWLRAEPFDTGIITMTSGTTGRPKAIACPTVAYAVAVRARQHAMPYGSSREVEACNVMFVWEAMRPMCYGHTTLVIPDDIIVDTNRLALFLHYYRATRLLSTPSLLSTMLDTAAETSRAPAAGVADSSQRRASPPLADALTFLRVWLLCGEVMPTTLALTAYALLPHVQLVNEYSSWEGSDVSLAPLPVHQTATAASGGRGSALVSAPVGRPLQGVRCAVLQSTTGELVPCGAVGELYVTSPMLFTAYVGAHALTADRLRPMSRPMREACGIDDDEYALEYALMHASAARDMDGTARTEDRRVMGEALPLAYCTGDLCRVLPSGDLQVIGRADSTIKIRGFKVGLLAS